MKESGHLTGGPTAFLADMLWTKQTFSEAILSELEFHRQETGLAPSRFAVEIGVVPNTYLAWVRCGGIPRMTSAEALWAAIEACLEYRRKLVVRILGKPIAENKEGMVSIYRCPACDTPQLEVSLMRRLWRCGRSRCPLRDRTAFTTAHVRGEPYPGDLLRLEEELAPYLKPKPEEESSDAVLL